MVFRGKPSKACERCRTRRLRCDLRSSACGQCQRANVTCSGYRDTRQLRIQDETENVGRKVVMKATNSVPQPVTVAVDLESQGVFMGYFIPNSSKYWQFLKKYYHPTSSPDALTLALEAMSLAYLWYQVQSESILRTARVKYVSALRMTNESLRSSVASVSESTVLTTLMLDVYEKITNDDALTKKSTRCHIDGALALINVRGLAHFESPEAVRILARLASNYAVNSIASNSPLPDQLVEVRSFVGQHLDIDNINWSLTGVIDDYANLRIALRERTSPACEVIARCIALDDHIQTLEFGLPPSWQFSSRVLEQRRERAFDLHFDVYPKRNICQGRNVLRIIRIFLNESILEYCSVSPASEDQPELANIAFENIKRLASDICACVPQYTDCSDAARQRLWTADTSILPNHSHTPSHQLDCHTLIFPLFVAARSNSVEGMRSWVIAQLRFLSSHFHLRAAEDVAKILEQEIDIDPWRVYSMLGSYAFAA